VIDTSIVQHTVIIFINVQDDSVFSGKNAWTATEEESLLDAMDMFSFGNWYLSFAVLVKCLSSMYLLSGGMLNVSQSASQPFIYKLLLYNIFIMPLALTLSNVMHCRCVSCSLDVAVISRY